jgi:tetratricopeptide (TPR) repeat protein
MEMNDFYKVLLQAAKDRWHTKTGLFAGVAALALFLLIAFAGVDLAEISLGEWGFVAFAIIVLSIYWVRTRIPRVPRGKVGFAIALDLEDPTSVTTLHSDFIVSLKELLASSNLKYQFHFIELPKPVIERITDYSQAKKVADLGNIHFLLWGRARFRTLPTGPSHVIDLHGLVRHSELPEEVCSEFANDFCFALPNRLVVESDGGMLACEFAAKHIDAVARYIIGTASLVSRDWQYAEQLLVDSESRLEGYVNQGDGATLSSLLGKVQERLEGLYAARLFHLTKRYRLERDKSVLMKAEQVVTKLRKYDLRNYQCHLSAAMSAFVLRRDVKSAEKEIKACRPIRDTTWRYSEAFLALYQGDLEKAYHCYQKAFCKPPKDVTVPTQSEEFIQIVLDEEPDCVWLHFGLGLINYKAKVDWIAAKRDFNTFVEKCDSTKYAKQVAVAKKWIIEIDSLLSQST